MRIITLFSIISLITIPMAIHLGDGSNWLWNNNTKENSYGTIGIVYVIALIVGCIAIAFRLYSMPDDQKESHDLYYNFMMGAATMLSVFCFTYLYSFTAAPITSENGWLNGWLIYIIVGLLPIILDCNNRIELLRQQSTKESGEQNIR